MHGTGRDASGVQNGERLGDAADGDLRNAGRGPRRG